MTQTEPVATKPGRFAISGGVLVLFAISVVAVGLGVGFHAQLGMPIWAAAGCAGLLYVAMILLHTTLMRGRRVADLEREVSRLSAEVGPAAGTATAAKLAVPVGDVTAPSRAVSKMALPLNRRVHGQDARSDQPAPAQDFAEAIAPSEAEPAVLSLAQELAMARALADSDPEVRAQPGAPAVATPGPAASRRLDASAIHELVKKLAEETAANARGAQVEQRINRPSVSPDDAATAATGDAIAESVRALRASADAMRPTGAAAAEVRAAPSKVSPAHARGAEHASDFDDIAVAIGRAHRPTFESVPESGPGNGPAESGQELNSRLSVLAEALSADRMDVMLEPILGLKDQATRHYEVSISLRSPEGELLDLNDDRMPLEGTGILPLIDLAKIARITEVARRLSDRGKTGSVFAGFAGESLGDDDFMMRLSEIYSERASITEQLVVALSQEDVRVFAPAHWAIVKDLGEVGFRFALEHLTDLDMDFDALRSAGVQYVKLDAEVFLKGLPAGNSVTIPAADVYRFLADKGLSLIVDHIDSETQLMRIVDCGVHYGQGQLFGGPRPVKAQVFAARPAA